MSAQAPPTVAPDREAHIRSLIRFAAGLGLGETTVRILYEAVVADAEIAPGDRQAEARRRLMMAVLKPQT